MDKQNDNENANDEAVRTTAKNVAEGLKETARQEAESLRATAVEAADRIVESAGALRSGQERLEKVENHNRVMIKILGISVAFDILMSILLGVVAYRADHAATVASSNHRSFQIACEAGNRTRALNRELWNYILSVSPTQTNLTPQQIQQRDQEVTQFKVFIAKAFAPQKCS